MCLRDGNQLVAELYMVMCFSAFDSLWTLIYMVVNLHLILSVLHKACVEKITQRFFVNLLIFLISLLKT